MSRLTHILLDVLLGHVLDVVKDHTHQKIRGVGLAVHVVKNLPPP